ncbi:Phosphoglycerate mutase [Gemmatirosa kalamazoonensis]|uniref:Phosphoglycerate mutase n=1 Tax=Gemmatirosa kalamazoonensis TaxID=861299 RepID=W0REP8_9BACT|nr:histidine phosphatase family protein [Gemmatirosa kalamazoonensis]AHG88922.1 Phosphoglycerate mutase [Gemmatirosa kalamazoonensis]
MSRRLAPLLALAVTVVIPSYAGIAAQPVTKDATAAAPTVVVLVRHAEKAAEPATDPALTPAGEARAQALAAALADAHVDAVLSTPYARTRATAAPLAARAGLTPEIVPIGAGGAPEHAAAVAAAIRGKHRGHTVLVVEHSNTIPAVIRALGGPAMKDLCDAQYASLFVLVLPNDGGAARLVRSTYGAADPPGADACAASGMR